jgi:Co/Zn/Cd efflux system component
VTAPDFDRQRISHCPPRLNHISFIYTTLSARLYGDALFSFLCHFWAAQWHLSRLTPLLVQAAAGYISGSTAMIADAAHSFSDIALSGVSLWSVRAAAMPKDREHPYGQSFSKNLVRLMPARNCWATVTLYVSISVDRSDCRWPGILLKCRHSRR